jgi:hypothetical protein
MSSTCCQGYLVKINLIELEGIKKFVKLPVLACFLELDIVLLKTVQSELGLVIDEDFERLKQFYQYKADALTICYSRFA